MRSTIEPATVTRVGRATRNGWPAGPTHGSPGFHPGNTGPSSVPAPAGPAQVVRLAGHRRIGKRLQCDRRLNLRPSPALGARLGMDGPQGLHMVAQGFTLGTPA